MATSNASLPQDQRISEGNASTFTRPWQNFFAAVSRKLLGAGQVTAVTTADASDLATAIALANALKAQVNALIAAGKL